MNDSQLQSITSSVNYCFSSQTSVHQTALLCCRTLWTNWAVCAKMLPKSAKLEFSTFTRWCRDTLEVWENLIIFIFEVFYGICQWKNLQNRFTLVEVVTKSCMWVTKYINHHHHQFNTHECMKNKTHVNNTHEMIQNDTIDTEVFHASPTGNCIPTCTTTVSTRWPVTGVASFDTVPRLPRSTSARPAGRDGGHLGIQRSRIVARVILWSDWHLMAPGAALIEWTLSGREVGRRTRGQL